MSASCHHGSSEATAGVRFGGARVVVAAEVALDTTLRVEFDAPIDPESLHGDAVALLAIDGPGRGVPARGTWRTAPANAMEFVPDLAVVAPWLEHCGFVPDTVYELVVVGGGAAQALRAVDGRHLEATLRREFTVRGTLAHAAANPARFVAVEPSPRAADGRWGLGGAAASAELRVRFDGPLDPSTLSGFALRYDDPVYGPGTAIDARVELEHNSREGAVVLVTPSTVLPSAAGVRLGFASMLRDLDGRGAIVPAVPTVVSTALAYEPQFDALMVDFARQAALGAADFAEVPAVVEGGALRVPDAFPDVGDVGDWAPNGAETVLRTDEQTLWFQNGRSATFQGGVLKMKNLHIGQGQVVRAFGPNPLVLVVDGDAVIDGVLSGDGADAKVRLIGALYQGMGDVVPPYVGPNLPGPTLPNAQVTPGPGGGAGGAVFWGSAGQVAGGAPLGAGHGGGGAGTSVCSPATEASAGGGGGGMVRGDPWFPSFGGSTTFVEALGVGASNSVVGGAAGEPWFTDPDPNNNFWGRAYVPREHRAVVGELARPLGGGGGGSGGSLLDSACNGVPFGRPGDGGGGGGVLVLQVRGRVVVGSTGSVHANGGNGCSIWNYAPSVLGGGGGGAGGTVVLMAGQGIALHTHGETFANRDYDFALAADGGVSRGSTFGLTVLRKYPANGQPVFTEVEYHATAFGGFGGMGAIQLMVPVGTTNADGTNTVLDDAITILRNGIELTGVEKQRYLGWRGFADANGVFVDDFGVPTGTIGGQGDMRPDPILMPCPFASDGRARARSEWQPLGGLFRREVGAPDGLPRAVVGDGLAFARHARADGWLPYGDGRLLAEAAGGGLLAVPIAIAAVTVDTASGRELQAVHLAAALPRTEAGAYTGRLAVFTHPVGGSWGRARVVASAADALFFEPGVDVPSGAYVQLYDWSADLATAAPPPDPALGLPRANARIGLAFHRDPEHAAATGWDPQRYPPEVGTFLYDLADPLVRGDLQGFGPRALQWDVVLDGAFGGAEPVPIALRRFWLPARF